MDDEHTASNIANEGLKLQMVHIKNETIKIG